MRTLRRSLIALGLLAASDTAHAQVERDADPCADRERTIIGSDLEHFDNFGSGLAVSGEHLFVCAPFKDGSVGGAYVFRLQDDRWLQLDELVPSDASPGDTAGYAMAAGDGWLFMGGRSHDEDVGAVWAYRLIGGEWVEHSTITPPQPGIHFGGSVATSRGWLFVGDDWNRSDRVGKVRVYRLVDDQWEYFSDLDPMSAQRGLSFGFQISATGDWVAATAPGDDFPIEQGGSTRLYRFNGSEWTHHSTLRGSDLQPWDRQRTVAMCGNTLLTGAPSHPPIGSGVVYVFQHDEQTDGWVERQQLRAPDPESYDGFGSELFLTRARAVVGATNADSLDGEAHYFELHRGLWRHRLEFRGPDNCNCFMGVQTALQGDWLLASAPDARGDNGVKTGVVYAFSVPCYLRCRADFDRNDMIDTRDVIWYLAAWSAGDRDADFNDDNSIDTRDFVAFLSAWSNGC